MGLYDLDMEGLRIPIRIHVFFAFLMEKIRRVPGHGAHVLESPRASRVFWREGALARQINGGDIGSPWGRIFSTVISWVQEYPKSYSYRHFVMSWRLSFARVIRRFDLPAPGVGLPEIGTIDAQNGQMVITQPKAS